MRVLLKKPLTIMEAYEVSVQILRFGGLFPFTYNRKSQNYQLSWFYLVVCISHIIIYSYINIRLLVKDWTRFAQPLIGESIITMIGNLVIRLIGILLSYTILFPVLGYSKKLLELYNSYGLLIKKATLIGIDPSSTFQMVQYTGICSIFFVLFLTVFFGWHSTYYYKLILEEEASSWLFFAIWLSEIYETMSIFYTCLQLMCVYNFAEHLNQLYRDLGIRFRKEYKAQNIEEFMLVDETSFFQ